MESEGLPNTGLYDQRAALQWVQNHISLVGGDPNNVSALGQSAGAASIFHHLIARGGTVDPLFHRALAMSPGFGLTIGRNGTTEERFQEFANATGCAGKGLWCLRAADISVLRQVNWNLGVGGPAPGGSYILHTPLVEIARGIFQPAQVKNVI
jgi:carboxylesterase type B